MSWRSFGRILAAVLSCSSAHAASFLSSAYQGSANIAMVGQIEPGDEKVFRETVLKHLRQGNWIGMVYVFSTGGNVNAAIEIGEQVRVLKASTVAPTLFDRPRGQRACMSPIFPTAPLYFDTLSGKGDRRCDCASACALIWAAGYGQQGNVVGLHRPHFDPAQFGKLSPAEAQEQYNFMLQRVEGYLKRMNFPERLIRVMYATSSQDIYYLSKTELKEFPDIPPYLQELVIARCALKQALNSSNSEAVRMKNHNCVQAIYEEESRSGGAAYLEAYGKE